MNIFTLICVFLIGAYVGAELAFYFIYSPKAQVKSLWKQIHKLTQFRLDCGNDSVRDSLVNSTTDKLISEKKKRINILLDYDFDPEEDKEFVAQHRA